MAVLDRYLDGNGWNMPICIRIFSRRPKIEKYRWITLVIMQLGIDCHFITFNLLIGFMNTIIIMYYDFSKFLLHFQPCPYLNVLVYPTIIIYKFLCLIWLFLCFREEIRSKKILVTTYSTFPLPPSWSNIVYLFFNFEKLIEANK